MTLSILEGKPKDILVPVQSSGEFQVYADCPKIFIVRSENCLT